MLKPILLLASLATPILLPAQQATVTLSALTPIAAMTAAAGGATTFQGIAQNTTIGSTPNNVFLTTNQSPTGKYLSAATICYPTMSWQGSAGFNFFERAYCRGTSSDQAGSSPSAAATGASFGPHAVLATFAAPPGTIGQIYVSYRQSADTNGTTSALIDVDNDGTAEFAQNAGATWSLPYTMGPSGQVLVRVANECTQLGDGSGAMRYSWTELFVSFRPDVTATCTISTYGQACGGVQAAGTELTVGQTRTIVVLATGCFPSSVVLFAVGSQQLGLQLPGGCSLLCNAEGVALLGSDAAGNASATWNIPSSARGTTYVQALPLDVIGGNLVITASNGVQIACQ